MIYRVGVLKGTGHRVREGGEADPAALEPVIDPATNAVVGMQPARHWWDALSDADLVALEVLDVVEPVAGQVWDEQARRYVTPAPDVAPLGTRITRTAFRLRIPFMVRAVARVIAAQVGSTDAQTAGVAGAVAELLARVEEASVIDVASAEVQQGAAFLLSLPPLVAAGMTQAVVDAMLAPATLAELPDA